MSHEIIRRQLELQGTTGFVGNPPNNSAQCLYRFKMKLSFYWFMKVRWLQTQQSLSTPFSLQKCKLKGSDRQKLYTLPVNFLKVCVFFFLETSLLRNRRRSIGMRCHVKIINWSSFDWSRKQIEQKSYYLGKF